MNCTLCNKPIVLVPSAEERAAIYGQPASYFKNLFKQHSECALKKREEDTLELMRKTNGKFR